MKEPIWVGLHRCLLLHQILLGRYGGREGIRDEGLLESALSKPLHRFYYEDASLFELAASYAAGIVKNHPFLDGNKRTGFFTAAFFLEKNGFKLNASEAEAAVMTVGLASGKCKPEVYAEWLKDNCSVP